MKYRDLQRFTKSPSYRITASWDYLEVHIERYIDEFNLQLDPDFQRIHVWDLYKQEKFIEYMIKGGVSGQEIYFNMPGWGNTFKGPMQLIDGKQRLEAVRRFLRGEIQACHGGYIDDYEDKRLLLVDCRFMFNINDLRTRAEVLQWYLDLNSGGVLHTEIELERVSKLLQEEKLK